MEGEWACAYISCGALTVSLALRLEHGHNASLLFIDASLKADAILIYYPYSGGSAPSGRYLRPFLITFHLQAAQRGIDSIADQKRAKVLLFTNDALITNTENLFIR